MKQIYLCQIQKREKKPVEKFKVPIQKTNVGKLFKPVTDIQNCKKKYIKKAPILKSEPYINHV